MSVTRLSKTYPQGRSLLQGVSAEEYPLVRISDTTPRPPPVAAALGCVGSVHVHTALVACFFGV